MQSLLQTAPATQPPPPTASAQPAENRSPPLYLTEGKQVSRERIPRDDHGAKIRRMQRVVLGAADAMESWHQLNGFRYKAAMLTLTYRNGDDWRPHQISTCMRAIRQWLHRRGYKLRAVWAMELQARGAPHYHIVVWLPKGVTLPKPDKQGWWPHGFTNCKWARKAPAYIAKYVSKGKDEQGAFPKGARVYGVYACPRSLGHFRAPKWLRDFTSPYDPMSKKKGGWWYVFNAATAYRSPWRVLDITPWEIEIEWKGWDPPDIQPIFMLEKLSQLEAETCF